ncbi:hypothetical protein X777_15126, partial [Ooceraea biroi]
ILRLRTCEIRYWGRVIPITGVHSDRTMEMGGTVVISNA